MLTSKFSLQQEFLYEFTYSICFPHCHQHVLHVNISQRSGSNINILTIGAVMKPSYVILIDKVTTTKLFQNVTHTYSMFLR